MNDIVISYLMNITNVCKYLYTATGTSLHKPTPLSN
ncbi:hypothetical protein PPL_03052 [Heterostelium album PN500]|uniref:Uncharacterized protein n=1 Tax=Heterostelium pallidum (strain ATCC 26659 / Pp 5 / PN500) TaxID=670386 RepID=D3B3T1_HETP5|nr:hypothetical protein PPL_03052 [Heterostelium album PN500]EFA83979.1 hypothetical protein PPL_03052 [Heterostelium album PN500]|eukprot:XP_020436096.1 hypothetical protein PPL_03052 [Heterostelium album PN500]